MTIQASAPDLSALTASPLLEDTPGMEMAQASIALVPVAPPVRKARNPHLPTGNEYGPHHP